MNILGYSSPKDFFRTLFGSLKHYKMTTLVPFAFAFAVILQVPFIEAWIWKPFWTLVLLSCILLLDFVLAVTSAKGQGESFKTEKATKFAVSLLAYWLTLAIAYNMAPLMAAMEVGGDEVWSYFAKAYFFFIFFLNLASAMRHMSDLGYLPKKVAAFFIKYIDAHKGRLLSAPSKKKDVDSSGEQQQP